MNLMLHMKDRNFKPMNGVFLEKAHYWLEIPAVFYN